MLTLFDTIQSFLANNYPKIDYPSSLCNQMGANWPRTHLKKGQKGKNVRKKGKIKKEKKLKERGLYLRILPRRNSFDDKPLYKISSCTVQNSFGQRKENILIEQLVIHLT